jgi:RNA polymerase sigma factor (sigma-70 family)
VSRPQTRPVPGVSAGTLTRSSHVLAVATDFARNPVVPLRALRSYRGGRQEVMAQDAAAAEERVWVEAAQKGDQEALRQLLERFARPIYAAVILPRVGDPVDAEDILRDTLSRAVERLVTFHWTGAGFYPWLRQIAINLVVDRARRQQRRNRAEGELERQAAAIQPLHHAGAEELLIEQQERAVALRLLDHAMGHLNDRQRRAIELRLLEERTREACAEALGVTVGNFDVILHRALQALRKAYGAR